MPVDRSLLPPLPGKPDWYVEDAPEAVQPVVHQLWEFPEQDLEIRPAALTHPARPDVTSGWARSSPSIGAQATADKVRGKVARFANKLLQH